MTAKMSTVAALLVGLIVLGLSFLPVPYEEVNLRVKGVAPSLARERVVQLRLPRELPVGEPVLLEMNLPAAEEVPAGAVLWEGRLELAGVSAVPGEVVLAPDRGALPVSFRWLITAGALPTFSGTLWLTEIIRSVDGVEVRVPMLARPLEFEPRTLMGLGLPEARWLGGSLAAAAAAVFLYKRMWQKTDKIRPLNKH